MLFPLRPLTVVGPGIPPPRRDAIIPRRSKTFSVAASGRLGHFPETMASFGCLQDDKTYSATSHYMGV